MLQEVKKFASFTECHRSIAGFLGNFIQKKVNQNGFATVALSGGSTPKALFHDMVHLDCASNVPWDKVMFFWGDERCVPLDHHDSNYKMAAQSLLQKLPVRGENVYPVPTELSSISEVAVEYERIIADTFKLDPAPPVSVDGPGGLQYPVFDFIMLGMGEDGHTASLFPGHSVLNDTGWVAAVNCSQAKPQVPRVTFTLPLINNADTILFLVSGAAKLRLVDNFLANPQESRAIYPAAMIRPRRQLIWYMVED